MLRLTRTDVDQMLIIQVYSSAVHEALRHDFREPLVNAIITYEGDDQSQDSSFLHGLFISASANCPAGCNGSDWQME